MRVGALERIDSKTLKVSAKLDIGASSAAGIVTESSDSVWMLVDDKTTLARIDPDQNAVVAEIRLPADCRSLTFGETALWLACPSENKVIRINPATNLVEKQIEVSAEPVVDCHGAELRLGVLPQGKQSGSHRSEDE